MIAKHGRGELNEEEIQTLDMAVDKYTSDRDLYPTHIVWGAFIALSKFTTSVGYHDRLRRYRGVGERSNETIEELIEKMEICLASDEIIDLTQDSDEEDQEGGSSNEEQRMIADGSMRMYRDEGMRGRYVEIIDLTGDSDDEEGNLFYF